jgi:hypothetical protein
MIGAGFAAVLLASASTALSAPRRLLQLDREQHKTAVGRCANVNRKWRVWAACDWRPDVSSDWVYQRGPHITVKSWPVCDFGIGRHWVEEKSL